MPRNQWVPGPCLGGKTAGTESYLPPYTAEVKMAYSDT